MLVIVVLVPVVAPNVAWVALPGLPSQPRTNPGPAQDQPRASPQLIAGICQGCTASSGSYSHTLQAHNVSIAHWANLTSQHQVANPAESAGVGGAGGHPASGGGGLAPLQISRKLNLS